MKKYYVDSCIWLNLLNKERTIIQGIPVWKLTEEFLKQKQGGIIISDFVRKEVINKLRMPESIIIIEQMRNRL